MPLDPGARLGPYEVLAPLGAGGMGEVYRARDPRLGRDVAVKVLPAGLSADAERLRRFEQEARAAAALNHPNILAVHDLGQHEGAPYIVSELLEGETLRERLTGTALPVRKAVEYAVQMAQGLAAAHEKGITHRDLKPENVFVTGDGRVKILDFGLAKLTQAEPALSGMSALPTTPPDTLPGVVLGTIGYMSPEQVRGQAADHRSDIFAFGVIVYEMLAGRRAFRGETAIETMSAILKEDPPDLPVTERHIPPALGRIIDRCLEKNPAARFKSADDLAFALETLSSPSERSETRAALPDVPARGARDRRPWLALGAVCGGVVATIAAVAATYLRPAPAPAPVYRSAILPPTGVTVPAAPTPYARFALSPDGRRLAFIGAEAGGATRLWVQLLDSQNAVPLPGTEGAVLPFWSPDSRFIAFRAGGQLKRIDASGGPPLLVTDAVGQAGTAWGPDGTILIANFPGGPIQRVPASGGTPLAATKLGSASGETYHAYPSFLPDGRQFLYLAVGSKATGPGSPNGIYVTALDSTERKLLVPGGSNAVYAQGYLFYLRDQTLLAHPFDVERLELTGDPAPVAENVATGGASGTAGGFSVATTGVFAYQTGSAEIGGQAGVLTQLTWFDRDGKRIATVGDEARAGDLALSPDGLRTTISVFDLARRSRDIWFVDIARGLRTRFTFDAAAEQASVWSPDGNRIVFNSRRKGHFDLYMKASSGAGADEELLATNLDKTPLDWSPDGRLILVGSFLDPQTRNDLWILPVDDGRKPYPYLQTPFDEGQGRFSSDGRWVAYVSNESGRSEVYVAPFPGPGGKWQVSTTGGVWPRWQHNGKELFYRAPDNRLMVAEVNGSGSAFAVGAVRPLFTLPAFGGGSAYDATPDGQRFLVNAPSEQSTAVPITLVVNWPALLRQ